jgi:hypothetical protein
VGSNSLQLVVLLILYSLEVAYLVEILPQVEVVVSLVIIQQVEVFLIAVLDHHYLAKEHHSLVDRIHYFLIIKKMMMKTVVEMKM